MLQKRLKNHSEVAFEEAIGVEELLQGFLTKQEKIRCSAQKITIILIINDLYLHGLLSPSEAPTPASEILRGAAQTTHPPPTRSVWRAAEGLTSVRSAVEGFFIRACPL